MHQQAVKYKEVSSVQTVLYTETEWSVYLQSHDGCPRSDKVVYDMFIKVHSVYLGLGQLPTYKNA
jgi:hypothetical protein